LDVKAKNTALCWKILPDVSRSFALCISILPKPLNEQMMISYLIYRILDTIEDSSAPLPVKKELFDQFIRLISKPAMNEKLTERCRADLRNKLDYTYEKDLLEQLATVMRTYYAQPSPVRRFILKWGRVMANGMYEFQQKPIETFKDQDRYGYHVAGVIGHLLNDLLHYNKIISLRLKRKLHMHARNFGLALQKINILRDVASDRLSNRHYWPRRLLKKYALDYNTLCLKKNRQAALEMLKEQIENAHKHLYSAMQYILLLPNDAIKVRRFCLIPLFMAIESYVKCINNPAVFDSGEKVKISRLQVHKIVAKSHLWCSSNDRLLKWFVNSMVRTSQIQPSGTRFRHNRSL